MKVFYINLEKDNQRRESMERQLSALGLFYERVPGVYGRALNEATLRACYSRRRALRQQSRELTHAEIGCAMSHIAVYRNIIDQALPYALILEDDVVVPPDLGNIIEQLKFLVRAERPEVILLSPADADTKDAANIRSAQNLSVAPYASGFFASSYIVTQIAAHTLLTELLPISIVADNWLRLKKFNVVDIYVTIPRIIVQDQHTFGSSTNEAYYQGEKTHWSRLVYKYRRLRTLALDCIEMPWRRLVRHHNDPPRCKND